MFVTRILEKKGVIQSFGVAMILAPFVNSATRIFVSHAPHERTLALYGRYLINKPFFLQALAILTIINGILMLQGKKSAWRFTLVVLGAYIAHQLMNFGMNFRESWVAALYLGTNILAFAFIVDQLVWKVEAPIKKAQPTQATPTVSAVQASSSAAPNIVAQPVPKASPAPTTVATTTTASTSVPKTNVIALKRETQTPKAETSSPPLGKVKSFTSSRRILLSFTDEAPWGRVTGISSVGFQVKCLLPDAPSGIESREVEFRLKNGLLLKARLADSKNGQYLFKYTNATPGDITRLNQWLRNIA